MLHRKIRNLFLCLVFLCSCAFIPGCDETSAQRIAQVKAVVDQASSVNQSIDASIEEVNLAVASCKVALADPNIPPDWRLKLEQALIKAKARLDSLLAQKKKATDLLATYQSLLAGIDANNATLETELALYGRGATALAPVVGGKTGGVLYLIGLLIPLAGGLIASVIKNLKQNEQLQTDKAILKNTVVSVNKLLQSDQVKDIEEAKFILQDSQTGQTQDAIDEIKGTVGPKS